MIQVSLQNRKRLADLENDPKAAGGKGRSAREGPAPTAALERDDQQDLLHAQGALLSVTWQPGREGRGERVHGCARLRPSAVRLKLPENC